jgi:hypothetical protein
MSYEACAPYRGYGVEVCVTPCKSLSFHGMGCRYRVSWSIFPPDNLSSAIASFPERAEFLHEDEAFRYGKNRAHTFIDCAIYHSSKDSSPA